MFLVTYGALKCFKKTHCQAADHQGGEAPRGPAVLTRVEVLEEAKIVSMIVMVVPRDVNRPLPSCLYNVRAHTGIKGISQEHEGALTQTEPAIIVQTPFSAKPWFSPVAGISVLGGCHWANAAPPFG